MLKKITLNLARMPEFPDGSSQHGYDFVAPLDAKGHLDLEHWKENRAACVVRRFWRGEDDEEGHLIRTKGGHWVFSYAPGEDDDEPIFRFLQHEMIEGEYISITEHDGVTRPFRIVSIRDHHVAPPADA